MNNCMHENQPQLNDGWLWVQLLSESAIHSQWALTRSYTTEVAHTGTNTSSTHSDVQTHIPLVGSWSKVRKCEICQPIGDWVIEEFDSERNILLPWWWTRRNDIMFSRRKVWQETQRSIINTDDSRDKQRSEVFTADVGTERIFSHIGRRPVGNQ